MDEVDCVVVGAGVVGLAAARALAQAGREVLLLEQHGGIGSETSSRSSEVIHAGLYYAPGSLKARLCVQGRQMLYDYLAERGLPHRRCGKLLVATDPGQLPALARLQQQAAACGVALQPLDAAAARTLEPALHCEAALWSPETGIVDTHALMLAYLGDAEAAGATLALHSRVDQVRVADGGFELRTGGDDALALRCRSLVNAAGLHAVALARRIEGLPARHLPTPYLAKGSYFTLAGRSPFTRLVYPMPDSAGLGVHLTLDLGGQARFGPDVEWVETVDYRVDAARAQAFYAAVRRYWPALPDGALQPGYAGVRPKIAGPGAPAADFCVQGPAVHGVAGLVNLFGIESPGITASLALGAQVATLLGARPAVP